MLAGFFHTLEVRLLATSNSLLIIGLPRSLSTHIYQVCRRVLKKELRHPTSTGGAATSGEILNYVPDWFGSKRLGETRMEFYPDFERILNEHAEGYVVKDVTQWAMVTRYLAENPGTYKLLRLHRNLADIVCRMWALQWMHPLWAVPEYATLVTDKTYRLGGALAHEGLRMLVASLVHIQETYLFPSSAEPVAYGRLVAGNGHLRDALRALGYSPGPVRYCDAPFRSIAKKKLAIRHTPFWHKVDQMVREAQNGRRAAGVR